MTTQLSTPVTRETTIRYKGRVVIVTLSPATPVDTEKMQPARPEHLEFHLKGTQQRVYLPLESVFGTARGAWRAPEPIAVKPRRQMWRHC